MDGKDRWVTIFWVQGFYANLWYSLVIFLTDFIEAVWLTFLFWQVMKGRTCRVMFTKIGCLKVHWLAEHAMDSYFFKIWIIMMEGSLIMEPTFHICSSRQLYFQIHSHCICWRESFGEASTFHTCSSRPSCCRIHSQCICAPDSDS